VELRFFTEKEEGFRYHNGNGEPQGFGVCSLFAGGRKARARAKMGGIMELLHKVSVDNLDAACARFEDLNDLPMGGQRMWRYPGSQ